MKTPWVSREMHEEAVAEMRRTIDRDRESHARYVLAAEARYDALLEKFTALRVAGAVPEAPKVIAPCPPDCTERAPHTHAPGLAAFRSDALHDLIDVKAGSNYRLRRMMLNQLAADRADGIEAEEIKRRIIAGVESSGVPG